MLLDYALRADSLPLFQAEISDVPSTPSGREAGARAASRRRWRWLQMRLSTRWRSLVSSTSSCRPRGSAFGRQSGTRVAKVIERDRPTRIEVRSLLALFWLGGPRGGGTMKTVRISGTEHYAEEAPALLKRY